MTGQELSGASEAEGIIAAQNRELRAQVVRLTETEAALQRQTEELERSNAELERFAFVASHQLREPLQVVAGLLDLLSEDFQAGDAGQLLDRARVGVSELAVLIGELLSYARASTGELLLEHIALDGLVDDAIAAVVAGAAGDGVMPTHDPLPTVVGDRWQLSRLFTHLLDNALEFRRHDDVKPLVHVGLSRSDGDWVFSVRDNGVGIEPAAIPALFTLFKSPEQRDDFTDSGVGLAISRRVVERHGGTIRADSIPGRGTTISFTLPGAEVGQ